MRFFILILGASFLASCGISQIDCPYQTDFSAPANAGCFIARGPELLVVQQRNGLYSMPGGTSEPGESSRCTAFRETYEEVGVQVRVGDLLQLFDNGFRLYKCQLSDNRQALQPVDMMEIQSAKWLQPASIDVKQWRFPEQRNLFIEWLLK